MKKPASFAAILICLSFTAPSKAGVVNQVDAFTFLFEDSVSQANLYPVKIAAADPNWQNVWKADLTTAIFLGSLWSSETTNPISDFNSN